MINLGFELTFGVPLHSKENLESEIKFLNKTTNFNGNSTVRD